MLVTWIIGLLLATLDTTPSRMADIGPAPRTVLIDSAGRPFDLASLKGKVVLVSFVYTTCNGTCPATTATLSRIAKSLEQAKLWGRSVEFVSITLDPRRDTSEVLTRYAQLFDANTLGWHFLTGQAQEVEAVIASWDMWARIGPTGTLDHPSRVFLLDPRGHQREIYNLEFLNADAVLRDARSLLAETQKK